MLWWAQAKPGVQGASFFSCTTVINDTDNQEAGAPLIQILQKFKCVTWKI